MLKRLSNPSLSTLRPRSAASSSVNSIGNPNVSYSRKALFHRWCRLQALHRFFKLLQALRDRLLEASFLFTDLCQYFFSLNLSSSYACAYLSMTTFAIAGRFLPQSPVSPKTDRPAQEPAQHIALVHVEWVMPRSSPIMKVAQPIWSATIRNAFRVSSSAPRIFFRTVPRSWQ